jgi:hypothetical protein
MMYFKKDYLTLLIFDFSNTVLLLIYKFINNNGSFLVFIELR